MSRGQQDRLSYAILHHFQQLIDTKAVTGEAGESLSVAIQCLTEALGVDTSNSEQTSKLRVDRSLQAVFDEAYPAPPPPRVATKDEEHQANSLKDEGNELMKQNKYEEAIEKYSEAIDVVPGATYYCNRAAAFSKLSQHENAVKDANSALQLDPGYSKAYARMGFAYLNMSKLKEAEESYSNALRLDPNNQSYKDNVEAVREKINAGPNITPTVGGDGIPGMPPGMAGMPPGMPNLAGMDFSQILNNPAFMNMAQQFMADPNMQQAFAQMADQFMTAGGIPGAPGAGGMPGAAPEGPGAGGGIPENFDVQAMMNNPALREMAESFEAQNPDMMDQLRRQFRPPGSEDQNNPDP